ncbi:MAG: penicillin-binding protein 2 [Cyanobacteria bacterium P01_F01_bin.153]
MGSRFPTLRRGRSPQIEAPPNRSLQTAIFVGLVSLPMLGIGLRLVDLQLQQGATFREKAELNRSRRTPIPAARGPVYDRQGKLLAGSQLTRSMYLTPQRRSLDQWRRILTPLEAHLERPVEELLGEIAEKQREGQLEQPIRIARQVSEEGFVIFAEQNLQTQGLWLQTEASRQYPQKETAAHVLGYTGEATAEEMEANPKFPVGMIVGRAGVERLADKELRGKWGYERLEADAKGTINRRLDRRKPISGSPVRLTLDLAMQKTAEDALGNRRGGVAAIEIKTGRVLALASQPGFDPNLFTDGLTAAEWEQLRGKGTPLLNRALQGYPPGSTFKVATAIAGMQSGKYTPSSRIPTFNAIVLGGHAFREHSGSYGVIGFEDALAYSSNTFFYQIGLKIGPEAIAHWSHQLGIGRPLQLGIGGGAIGSVPTPATKQEKHGEPWYAGDTVSMSIGQGVVLGTPLELAVMTATVVNGGNRVIPHLLDSQTTDPAYRPQSTGIDANVLKVVRDGMVAVVTRGTARNLGDGSIPLNGGKTGTAEVPNGRSNAMFVGFAPANDPQIAIAVAVENGGYGGAVAAPIAKAVYGAYFKGPKAGSPLPPLPDGSQ